MFKSINPGSVACEADLKLWPKALTLALTTLAEKYVFYVKIKRAISLLLLL